MATLGDAPRARTGFFQFVGGPADAHLVVLPLETHEYRVGSDGRDRPAARYITCDDNSQAGWQRNLYYLGAPG